MRYTFEVEKKIVPVTRETALRYWAAWETVLRLGGLIGENDHIDGAKVLALYPDKTDPESVNANG